VIEPPQAIRTGSNLVDMGRAAAHDHPVDGRLRRPARFVGWEATVKGCGVAVARLPGNSWAPPPSTGAWWTWEPPWGCPPRRPARPVAGRSAVGRWPWGGTEPP